MVRGVRKTITEGGSLKYRPHFSMGTVYERSEKCDCKKDNSDCSIRWVTEEDESTGGYDVWVPGNLLLARDRIELPTREILSIKKPTWLQQT